jgi:hypothetical protein
LRKYPSIEKPTHQIFFSAMQQMNFKAIVLTYDRNACVARHMIARYESLWPDHPFTFRIPYQHQATRVGGGDISPCEFVPSPLGIKKTVDALIGDLPDEEWIYWCLDDKYPIHIDVSRLASLARELRGGGALEVSGVLFCRARRMLDESFLTGYRRALGGEMLLERRAYEQFWIHQFLRVKVVRHLFSCFPDKLEPASIMDRLKRAVYKPADHRLWVTAASHAVFGESMRRGVLTENCIESMRQHGIPIPSWQPTVAAPMVIIGQSSRSDIRGMGAFGSSSEDGAE